MRYPYSVERRLLDQISSNDYFVFATDLGANITFCNDAFQRIHQIVGESVVGVNIDSLINSVDAGLIKDAIHQTLLNKSSDSIILKLKDPGVNTNESFIQYEFTVVKDRRSNPVAFLLVGKSTITTSIQPSTNSVISTNGTSISGQNREWFREIADYMKDMMWMSDHQHQINFVNKSWQSLEAFLWTTNLVKDGWMEFTQKINSK